jgi:uncharacterized protein
MQELHGVKIPNDFRVIFSCLSGSHMYGTSTPASDVDVRGVFIPSKEYFMGFQTIEQFQCKEPDTTYFEIRKFMRLALDCNPNIIEHLFVPESEWKLGTREWEEIVAHKEWFLSKKARWTFSGYATSQLHRIKNHRKWLLDPPTVAPVRSDFGLPENSKLMSADKLGAFNVLLANYLQEIHMYHPLREQIEALLENYDYLSVVQKLTPIDPDIIQKVMPINEGLLEMYQKEQAYSRALSHWNSYLKWKKGRNPARAELESKFGYDTKHASHLVRLLMEGEELLLKGTITLPLPYADHILSIRRGAYTYDGLMAEIGDIDTHFSGLYDASVLPKKPNRDAVDDMCIRLVEAFLK